MAQNMIAQTNTSTGVSTDMTTATPTGLNDPVNWLWFIPLVMVVLIVALVFGNRGRDDVDDYRHHRRRLAGTKGGEARKARAKDTEELDMD